MTDIRYQMKKSRCQNDRCQMSDVRCQKKFLSVICYLVSAICFLLSVICFAGVDFKDESPNTEWQHRTRMDCYVTVFSTVQIDMSSIRFRVSNSGSGLENFGYWRSSATVVYNDVTEVRFSTGIPNSYGDEFKVGSDNYIQWSCKDTGGNYNESNPFKINIFTNEPPQINILQPKNNGYATLNPLIEAEVSDEGDGIDVDSIVIKIDELDGANIVTVGGDVNPEIFDSSSGIISYTYEESALKNNNKYRLTISAKDSGYVESEESSESIVFTTEGGMIADLINYPNPFDPKEGETTIRYVLKEDALVTINIYDASRELVKTVIEGEERSKGLNEDGWDGRSFAEKILANGIYFCEFIAKNEEEHRAYQTIAILGK